MTEATLIGIYEKIRKSEFRRRELARKVAEARERAAAIPSWNGNTRVTVGIRQAPQERFIERMSEYEEELEGLIRRADELAGRYFYGVQRLIPWAEGKEIHAFITGSAPYTAKLLRAIRHMAAAINGDLSRAQKGEEFPLFVQGVRGNLCRAKPLTKEQEKRVREKILQKVAGKELAEIVEVIRRKCRRRNRCEREGIEDEILYAQICALEREYVYSVQSCLTEKELLFVELYMTDELSDYDLQIHKRRFGTILAKLSAARNASR